MDKVIIKRLRTRAIVGILEKERKTPQDVLVTVTVFTDVRSINTPDDISNCLDYFNLSTGICNLVQDVHRFTLEALAEDIASFCLAQPKTNKVIVLVQKPEAIPDAESAGVEIMRYKKKKGKKEHGS